jgi:hypothetical protein
MAMSETRDTTKKKSANFSNDKDSKSPSWPTLGDFLGTGKIKSSANSCRKRKQSQTTSLSTRRNFKSKKHNMPFSAKETKTKLNTKCGTILPPQKLTRPRKTPHFYLLPTNLK